jgi:hypothetical protein
MGRKMSGRGKEKQKKSVGPRNSAFCCLVYCGRAYLLTIDFIVRALSQAVGLPSVLTYNLVRPLIIEAKILILIYIPLTFSSFN